MANNKKPEGRSNNCNKNGKRGSNGKGKGRKPYNKRPNPRPKDSEGLDENEGGQRRYNDPNWYFTNTEVADQASQFSFNQFTGRAFSVPAVLPSGAQTSLTVGPASMMIIGINPSVGLDLNPTSGINMASLKLFTNLSARNAKTTQYAPQDLTILMLSLGEVLSIAEHIRRAFGVAMTYNIRNRDLPQSMLQAMGVNSKDFLSKLADYRLQFNAIITTIDKIPFPAGIAYLFKCMDLYQNVYTDSESPMAEYIIQVPYSTWILKEDVSDKGSTLVTTNLPIVSGIQWTMDAWLTQLQTMVDAILQSSTFNYIYADVLNWNEKTGGALFYLDYLTESYSVVPIYNANFLLQLHNTIIVGPPKDITDGTSQSSSQNVQADANSNSVIYEPQFDFLTTAATPKEVLVDFPTAMPSIVDRIEATRFLALPYEFPSASGELGKLVLPDHYAVILRVCVPTAAGLSDQSNYFITKSWRNESYDESSLHFQTLMHLSKFDWAPLQYVIPNTNPTQMWVDGDLNYYTTIDVDWLVRVNDLTMQALFELR